MTDTFFQRLQNETKREREYLLSSPLILSALRGTLPRRAYLAFLGQAYHHVKHTVPLLMACGARLPDRLGWLRAAMAEYIEEENGHEQWILNDIAAAGGDPLAVRQARPNLATELMVSYVYDTIARGNPVGFLGMVNVLEGTSIRVATEAAGRLRESLGLPGNAFSYLESHGSLDVKHVAFFEGLVNRLEREEDRQAVIHAARVVYRLYADMFRTLDTPDALPSLESLAHAA